MKISELESILKEQLCSYAECLSEERIEEIEVEED